ncbi:MULTISPECIES: hypothetical protein [unclassified Nesterenkonia]|uniref:hypothetical protein n=1 Tax=unclassified Nesterenkonia TaxID=2629769 RepID=UPI0008938AA5|nr:MULTISPECIES: hypothetical protein [unclassified Nesterenkonia]MDZ5077858.1 hypothetical protein [Nesterenkonia sp. HG001]
MSTAAMTAIISLTGVILTVMAATQGHLWSRLKQAEDKAEQVRAHSLEQDRRIGELWDKRREDAVVIRLLGDHIDTLEDHIRDRREPPPPPRPEGL